MEQEQVNDIKAALPVSSRKNSLNECFEDLTLSGSLNNSFNSDLPGGHAFQGANPGSGFSIKIPIPHKMGKGLDTTKPVFNNPFLEDFLKWPVSASDPDNNVYQQQQQQQPPQPGVGGGNKASQSAFLYKQQFPPFRNPKGAFENNLVPQHPNSDGLNSSFSSNNDSSFDTKNTPDSDTPGQLANSLPLHSNNLFSLPFLGLFSTLGAFNIPIPGKGHPKFVGPLTFEERQERIRKYLEKKKSRRWKTIRYSIRKNLAEKRQRFQGRFVKSKMPFYFGGMTNEGNSPPSDHTGGFMRDPSFSD